MSAKSWRRNVLRPTAISLVLLALLFGLNSSLLRPTGFNTYLWHVYWPLVGFVFFLFNRDMPRNAVSSTANFVKNPKGLKSIRYAKTGLAVGFLVGTPSMFVDVLCSDNDLCEFIVLVPAYLSFPLYFLFSIYFLYVAPLWYAVLGLFIGYDWGRRRDRSATACRLRS